MPTQEVVTWLRIMEKRSFHLLNWSSTWIRSRLATICKFFRAVVYVSASFRLLNQRNKKFLFVMAHLPRFVAIPEPKSVAFVPTPSACRPHPNCCSETSLIAPFLDEAKNLTGTSVQVNSFIDPTWKLYAPLYYVCLSIMCAYHHCHVLASW